jgi:hypothetical protein
VNVAAEGTGVAGVTRVLTPELPGTVASIPPTCGGDVAGLTAGTPQVRTTLVVEDWPPGQVAKARTVAAAPCSWPVIALISADAVPEPTKSGGDSVVATA